MRRIWFVACFGLFCTVGPACSAAVHRHLVFAHYMVCCSISGPNGTVDDYVKEIRLAQHNGIDGFALNFGSYPGSQSYSQHIKTMDRIFDAARHVPNFCLFLSFDQMSANHSISTLLRYASNSNYLQQDNKLVVSGWGQTVRWAEELRRLARERGLRIFIVPHMNYPIKDNEYRLFPSEERNLHMARVMLQDDKDIDGVFSFGAGGPYQEIAKSYPAIAKLYHGQDKMMMAGISGFYRGFNNNSRVFESDGFEGMRARWLAAITGGADWVQFVTWNDWDEATYVQPFDQPVVDIGKQKSWQNLLDHGGFLRASRYYISWFKTGRRPIITKDSIFYFYRPQLATTYGVVDFRTMKMGRPRHWEHLHDKVFITAYLISPLRLEITTGTQTYRLQMREGVHSVSVPAQMGSVRISAIRGARKLADETLPLAIRGDSAIGDFNYLSGEVALTSQ